MRFNDARSFKVVILADYFVNSHLYRSLPDASRVYETIRDSGWGIIKMPPADIGKTRAKDWVISAADQIQEYGHRGFRVVLLGMKSLPGSGLWIDELSSELRRRGVDKPRTKLLTRGEVKGRKLSAAFSRLFEN